MNTHSKRAKELFESGCQCAQAVFVALCDVTGIREEDALALSSSFGGGIGRMREMCGALCGMLVAIGFTLGRYAQGDAQAKDRHYRLTQYAAAKFKQKTTSIFCYELLNIPHEAQLPVSQARNQAFYHERPCLNAVCVAAEVFDELMEEQENGTLEQKISLEHARLTTDFLNQRD